MKFITLSDPLPYQACVATIGFFDGVHRGHCSLIQQLVRCASLRGLPSVLITFRAHPRQVMHAAYQPQLLSTYEEKCALLAATGADFCVTLDFTPELAALSARQFMSDVLKRLLAVNTLLVGYDHRFGHGRSEGFSEYVEIGKDLGIEVRRAEAFSMGGINVSSSVVRSLLTEGEVGMAARCLARPYSLSGTVVEGFHVGHDLGFPTANLQLDDALKLVPKDGVYAVDVRLNVDVEEQSVWKGMLNIGCRPTLDNGTNRTIEVYVLDFDGDLYGRHLSLDFISRLRDEKKFRSKGELANQLRLDEKAVRSILERRDEGDLIK